MYSVINGLFQRNIIVACFCLVTTPVYASTYTQITNSSYGTKWVQYSADNQIAVFSSRQDITGSNPDNYLQLYKIDLQANNIEQITALDRNIIDFELSGNGQIVAYQHNGNEFNQNADGEYQIFYRNLNTNEGYQLSNITSADDPYDVNFPRAYYINFSGNLVFHSVYTGSLNRTEYYTIANNNFTTTLPGIISVIDITISKDGSSIFVNDRRGIKRINSSDGMIDDVLIEPTSGDFGTFGITLSNEQDTVYFSSDIDPLGTNPDSHYELFKIDIDGNNIVQMTQSDHYSYSYRPRIFKNNSLVYFDSRMDFVGENPTKLKRIFSIDDNLNIAQMPNIDHPIIYEISANGNKILYWIFTKDDPADNSGTGNGVHSLYIMNIDGSNKIKITDSYTDLWPYPYLSNPPAYISEDGSYVLFSSNENILGTNSDQSYEIYLWDANASPTENVYVDPVINSGSSSGGALSIKELSIFFFVFLLRICISKQRTWITNKWGKTPLIQKEL